MYSQITELQTTLQQIKPPTTITDTTTTNDAFENRPPPKSMSGTLPAVVKVLIHVLNFITNQHKTFL
jgi:hypothetical protein